MRAVFLCLLLTSLVGLRGRSQEQLSESQVKAIQMLDNFDTTAVYSYWPHVTPTGLYHNLKANLLRPERIYQGHSTNFCSYSALTTIFCKEQPEIYVKLVLDLYASGKAEINGQILQPSKGVRNMAGALPGKGKLGIYEADQLWLLTLPDHFKSYMNVDRKYKLGDENLIWAACTLGKFNRMAETLGGYQVTSRGADLIKPGSKDLVAELKDNLAKGNVVLYVNSKYLHPSKFRIFTLRAPTHFIVLYDIREVDGAIVFTYWDYGLKTLELMSLKRIRKMTFGIIRLNKS